jgi:pimeloyl-ACP methyl ester carboxylesterase
MIGWSLGAQTVLTCCASCPASTDRLFLLNPSGKTLHSVLQPFFPLPEAVGGVISVVVRGLFSALRSQTYSSPLWNVFKATALSPVFRALLEVSAFLGGFPPEQPLWQPTIIISGLPDVMTGVYHSHLLAASMPRAAHVMFTMGSHFVIMEWPQLVAKELISHLSI